LVHPGKPPELRKRHCRLEFGHVVVEAETVIVTRAIRRIQWTALRAEFPGQLDAISIRGDSDAAIAGGYVLALLEAEAAEIAERAHPASAVAGAVALRAVFDDRYIVLPSDFQDAAHVARI